MTVRLLPLLAGVLVLSVTSAFADASADRSPGGQTQPPPAQGQGQGQAQGQGQGQGGRGQQRQQNQQARDRAQVTPQGTSVISGRVLTVDTGRPVKRARVTVSGGGRGGRTATTDDQGRYQVGELTAGNYTITASKNGFVDSIYGQRRPQQPGTPVTLADTQVVANIDIRLTRGGVITGVVRDEDGEALPRAMVTVQRYQYVQGQRQLTPAGADQTDDRGQYRVFALPPGDYYVSASTQGLGELLGRGLQQLAAGIGALGGRGGGRGAVLGPLTGSDTPEPTGYAPTYFPGVVSAPEAGKVTVAPGQEVGGIDFQIQLVPLATVSGIVAGAEDVVAVMLMAEDAGGRGPMGGPTLTSRSLADGTFTISNVPPGRYVAIARAGGRGGGDPRTAMQSLIVNGQNITGVSLMLQGGVTLSGNITVESSGTPAPTDYSGFRIDVPDVSPLPFGGGGGGGGGRAGLAGGAGRAQKNGAFEIGNLLPGKHYIRIAGGAGAGQGQAQGQRQGQAQGRGGQAQAQGQWTLKSVLVAGQDVTDQPVDFKPGQNVDNVTIVLTDRSTEVTGSVRDVKNAPMTAITVIAFSTDQQYWRAQSRLIQTARTDSNGAFRLRGLPPGDYFIVAVDGVEQGEWFDPAYLEQARAGAARLTVREGDKKTQDLRGPGA